MTDGVVTKKKKKVMYAENKRSMRNARSFPCLTPPCVHIRSPDAADSSSFDVQLGDIILTATDGLFDNMPDYMILQELKKLKVRRLKHAAPP